jgi:hypothetical protein
MDNTARSAEVARTSASFSEPIPLVGIRRDRCHVDINSPFILGLKAS